MPGKILINLAKFAFIGIVFASINAGCAHQQQESKSPMSAALNCSDDNTQRLLTYCASPEAAHLARQQHQARESILSHRPDAVPSEFMPVPVDGSASQGPDNALVTVVMFTDLECQFCAYVHQSLLDIYEDFPETVKIVFKHAPLPIHDRAEAVALAAEALRTQQLFWPFVHLMYQNPDNLMPRDIERYIIQLGGDLDRWSNDVAAPEHLQRIQRDQQLGYDLGVEGTPTLFINGMRLVGVQDDDFLRQLITQQIRRGEEMLAAGVPHDEIYWRSVLSQYIAPNFDDEPELGWEDDDFIYVPVGDSPVIGADVDDALVTIVEFADFQCSFCARGDDVMQALLNQYGDRIRRSFKHFPLPFHDRAGHAAALSVLAHRYGLFWQMHEQLFSQQHDFSDSALMTYAQNIELPVENIGQAMREQYIFDIIGSDIELGQSLGVQGTPTYFINGQMVVGLYSFEELSQLIEMHIEHAQQIQADTGLKGEELYRVITGEIP